MKMMAAKKILIVDDDPGTVSVLEYRFRGEGYETCVARDGEEAVIKTKEERPDLIVLDVLLPKMTGYGVMWTLREDKELALIPLMVISAQEVVEKFFLDLPRVEFMAKPLDFQAFSEKVGRLIAGVGGPDAVIVS
jgi:two-component system, OmpR family, alkaline phosphatase synthesis response regulator PhoP